MSNEQQDNQSADDQRPPSAIPVEETPLEVEPTRRAASAQFVINSDVGSAAALREAMDPANRSLAEALQMSFRVLQIVIVVLLILFFFSGFKTVGPTQSGVATVWGRIVDKTGLEPGLQMNWPPPIGEFMLFESDGREASDQGVFLPMTLMVEGLERSMESANNRDELLPGEDGSFLTDGGEIAHVHVEAKYRIEDPVHFLTTMHDDMANAVVRVAIQRAVVHVGASHKLQELQDDFSNEEIQEMVADSAQTSLDIMGSGIRITTVILVNEITPPLFIQKISGNFSQAKQTAESKKEWARKDAQDMLITAAGKSYMKLEKLMSSYEEAWTQDLPDADVRLAEINAFIDSKEIAGTVARTISAANRFQSLVDQTLGREARRFSGLLPAYRDHPELVIAEKWLEAYGKVMAQPDAEIMYVPEGLGSMGIDITGLESVRDIRRRADIEAREQSQSILSGTASDYMLRADEIKINQAQRQLKIDKDTGSVAGMREELLDKDK